MRKFILLVFIFALTAKEKRFAKQFFTFAQCLNEDNKPVDFFYSYKLPRIKKLNLDGYEYSYITSEDVSGDEENLIARTLRFPMLKSDHFILAYNDEEPNGPNDDTGGHTKGVFATDGNVGFWIVHSVPKFPDINSFHYPENAVHNGQSFLCISVNSSEIETVGEQLIYNEVNIYGSKIPPKLKGKFPKLEDAIQKKWKKNGPFENLKEFKSLNGTKFLSFAKGRHFNKELYV
uniref:Uncharacterized protein n=1 Tax=Megaselia scalaris TaxID=36166 RepID=T1H5H8_MEGSC